MKNSKDRGRSQVKPKGPRSARPKAPLHNPVAIAEDQADLLIAEQRVQERPMKTLDQYLVERGHELAASSMNSPTASGGTL
jgi:hypothetical protein